MTSDMDLINEWKEDQSKSRLTARKVFDNEKLKSTPGIDALLKPINDEIVSKIDCLECGNCCKTTVTVFNQEDISKASNYLGISKKAFINKYLIMDVDEFTTIQTPCPFLKEDNKCGIYEVRPHACASFPHTQRKSFLARRKSHESNYVVCPITYHIVNKLNLLF
jgi:uncharacterized protein